MEEKQLNINAFTQKEEKLAVSKTHIAMCSVMSILGNPKNDAFDVHRVNLRN